MYQVAIWGKKVADVYVYICAPVSTAEHVVYVCNYTYVYEKEIHCVNINELNLSGKLLLWDFHSCQQLEKLQFKIKLSNNMYIL